jgi:homoserine O-acetyltransferase
MSEENKQTEKSNIPCEVKTFRVPQDLCSPAQKLKWKGFSLESGAKLPQYHLAYTTCGKLNTTRSNVVWIFHALTANSQPQEWWEGLVGEGKLFDPAKYFIVCVNTPGSCYGSIGPLDIDTTTGKPFYQDFPFFTTRDLIRSYQPLRHFLGIEKIQVGIGGSMGGQQLLEWAIEEPELFEHIIPIATNAIHSPWGIAFNTTQRMIIEADGTWKTKHAKAGEAGMKAARALALISYRSYEGYGITQSNNSSQWKVNNSGEDAGGAASYQRYQGEKLAKRFNAFSYYTLTKTMDSHNVGRERKSIIDALQNIRARTLVIGIDSDVLFPLSEQHFLADHIPHASFTPISSQFGHDGFLLEFDTITKRINAFLSHKKVSQ